MAADPNAPDPAGLQIGHPSPNWWLEPEPAWHVGHGPWPPPLPPGGQYGPNPMDIVYPPGTPGAPNINDPMPGVPPATPGAPAPTPTPTPGPTGTPPPTAPKTYTYDEALAYAQQQAQSIWGRQLTAAEIENVKKDLGFTAGAAIQATAGPQITSWLTAHKPAATGGGGGGGGGTGGGDLVPPGGSYGVAPPTPPMSGTGGLGGLPAYKTPAPYQSSTFTAPTAADLLADPSYQFRFDQGIKAVEADKAAKGVLNGGGTAQDLLRYGQDFGSQEYKNVWDRSLSTYNTNEGNRFKDYASNVLTQNTTPYDYAYTSAVNQQGQAQTGYQNNYQNWLSSYNAWRNSRNDAFDQKWKVATG